MNPWRLQGTYAIVRSLFGRSQEELVRASTRSVLDRKAFAAYHFQETQRLTKSFERRYLSSSLLIDLYSEEGQRTVRPAFELFILKAGAHTTAAVQSVHAIPDILAHVVYFALGQNLTPTPLPERDIALQRVVNMLRRERALLELAALLASSQLGPGWRHLSAVANESKHRSVVRATLNEDLTGTRAKGRELQVSQFQRADQQFPACSVQSLLEPEFNRLSALIVGVGHALNSVLRDIAVEPLTPS